MFDLRYHVASLAAVFVALAVGIVIGVAIAGGGNLEETTQGLRQADFDALEQRLEEAQGRLDGSERSQRAFEELVEDVYPALIAGRLAGREIALLFVGSVEGAGAARDAVQSTLADADAGGGTGIPTRVTALELPIDVDGINALLDDDPAFAVYVGDAQLPQLGVALGRELVRGGETPLWDLLAAEIVEQRSGSLDEPVDGVVVIRSWTPEPSPDPTEEGRHSQTEALIGGLMRGLGETGVPVVGVETSTADVSTIDGYRRAGGVSSVDDIDIRPGRLALALLLTGGGLGHYGTKETADAVVPPIDPLTITPLLAG